jgi:hypothetical protein
VVNNNLPAVLFGALCFLSIPFGTWFFSYNPRLFIRVFVPREEWRKAVRSVLREPNYGRGMRWMALLQFAVAIVVLVIMLAVGILNR